MEEWYFTAQLTGERLDKFLAEELSEMSRSHIQKLIKDGNISVNQKPVKSNYKLSAGDEITVSVPEPEIPDILPEDIPHPELSPDNLPDWI